MKTGPPSRVQASMLALLAVGCASPDAARRARLHDWLVEDNQIWLARDADTLARKYDRMAEDAYGFYRATAGWFYEDLSRPGSDRGWTTSLDLPAASRILVFGDAHPENVGTMRPGYCPAGVEPDPPLSLEIADLDAAGFGSWILDLRRAAVGISTLAAQDCGDCADAVTDALVRSWAEQIGAAGDPRARWSAVAPGQVGGILEDLLDEAQDEGEDAERLGKYSSFVNGTRALDFDESVNDEGRGLLALSAEEAAQVERLAAGLPGLRLLSAGRLMGIGTSSLVATRYLLLWDRGDPAPDDDDLLILREVIPPPTLPGLGAWPTFPDEAARVREAAALLWSQPDADACATALLDGAMAFKALSYSSWFQNIDREDILGAGFTTTDWLRFAQTFGAALAGGHARSITADGEPALPVIVEDLTGEEQALRSGLVAAVASDRAQLLEDYASFLEIRETWGPLLGADSLGDDLP